MPNLNDLDRLLVTMDVAVRNFAVCEVKQGRRLVGSVVDAIMVHYVLVGTMHMTLPGLPPIVCGPGGLVLVPPGLQPSMTADGGIGEEVVGAEHCTIGRDGLMLFDAAEGGAGDLRIVAGIIVASVSGSFGLLDRLRAPLAEDLGQSSTVQHAYAAMLSEIATPSFGSGALTASLMKVCLIIFLRRFVARAEAAPLIGGLANPRLTAAIDRVIENPAASHTRASLADAASMTVSTFARQFQAAFEMSPMEFVAKTRLRHGAEMLRGTNLPVKLIASSIGFSSRSHFSRAFREAYGSDPSAFRAAHSRPPLDAPAPLHGTRETYALAPESSLA
jgi:AraC family transcriptional activator of mtrCDE